MGAGAVFGVKFCWGGAVGATPRHRRRALGRLGVRANAGNGGMVDCGAMGAVGMLGMGAALGGCADAKGRRGWGMRRGWLGLRLARARAVWGCWGWA